MRMHYSEPFLPVPVSPIKRKNARSLYQYINYSSATGIEPPVHDPTSDPQCTCIILDDVKKPEELDPGHSNTASGPETGTQCFEEISFTKSLNVSYIQYTINGW